MITIEKLAAPRFAAAGPRSRQGRSLVAAAVAVALGTAGWSGRTSAQTAAPDPAAPAGREQDRTQRGVEEIVVTASRYHQNVAESAMKMDIPVIETPQAVNFVTRDLIEDTASRYLEDVAERVSGTQKGFQNFGIYRQLGLRGFVTDNLTSYKEDGLTVVNQIDVDLSAYERVEIVKGPSSVLYGQNIPGGMINRITKKPLDEAKYSVRLQGGSYEYYRGEVDATGPINDDGTVRYRLTGAYDSFGTNLSFDAGGRDKRVVITPVLEFDAGDNTLIRLSGAYQDDKGRGDNGLPVFVNGTIPPVDYDFSGELPWSRWAVESKQGAALVQHRIADSSWVVRVRGNVHSWTRAIKSGYLYAFGGMPLSGDTALYAGGETQEDDTYAGEVNLEGRFELFGREHSVLFGVEHVDLNKSFNSGAYLFLDTVNIFNPDWFDTPEPFGFEGIIDDGIDTETTGFYAQLLLKPTDRLSFLIGGRLDEVNSKFIRESVPSSSADYSEFSPRLGMVYELPGNVNVYASASRAFQTQLGNDRDGNLLDPSLGEQVEIGAKGSFFGDRLLVTLALFDITKKDIAQRDLTCPPTAGCAPGAQVLVGEQQHRGVELDVVGEPIPGLNVIAAVSYLDAEISRDTTGLQGNIPPGLADTTASLWATYEIQSGTWRGVGFGGGLYYVGDDRQVGRANLATVEGYTRLDATLFYRGFEKLELALNVNNLTDEEYVESGLIFGGLGFGVSRGRPLTVTGSMTYRF